MRGKMKDLIKIQRRADVERNAYQDLTSYEDLVEVWSERRNCGSGVVEENGQLVNKSLVDWLIDSTDIDVADRIICNDRKYKITGIEPVGSNMLLINTYNNGKWQ